MQSDSMKTDRLHGCEFEHLESVPVTETFQGRTLWHGTVEVSTLCRHPKAKRGYPWSHGASKDDAETRFETVLELHCDSSGAYLSELSSRVLMPERMSNEHYRHFGSDARRR